MQQDLLLLENKYSAAGSYGRFCGIPTLTIRADTHSFLYKKLESRGRP